MRLKNILITVKDMEKSKRFYQELFGIICRKRSASGRL